MHTLQEIELKTLFLFNQSQGPSPIVLLINNELKVDSI